MDTLLKLRGELDYARNQYHLAQYIDSTARMQEEQAYWSSRIEMIKAEIAEIDDDE